MATEDLARALHDATAMAIQEAESRGDTTVPHYAWADIKGRMAHQFPRDFQQAIDTSIEYNNGVFDDNVLDEHLDKLIAGYNDRLESKILEKE